MFSACTISAHFYRSVQSISSKDEETKKFLKPFLVQIANGTGVSPFFFRYTPI